MYHVYLEISQLGDSGSRQQKMIGRRGKMKPGIVASLQGTREPRMNIRNVPATNPVLDVTLIVSRHTSIPEEAVDDEEVAPELGDGDLPEVERGDGRDEPDTQTRHRPAAWTYNKVMIENQAQVFIR